MLLGEVVTYEDKIITMATISVDEEIEIVNERKARQNNGR